MITSSLREREREAKVAAISKIFLKLVKAALVAEIGDSVLFYDGETEHLLAIDRSELCKKTVCERLNVLRGNFYRWRMEDDELYGVEVGGSDEDDEDKTETETEEPEIEDASQG